MKIGLIGAENSHAEHFCKTINGEKAFPGHTISYLYGADDPEKAARLCAQYGVTPVESEEELIALSDAVVITYRRGSAHFDPAMAVLRAGKPLFNDKPFCTRPAQCRELIDYALAHHSLLCGGSNLKGLEEIPELKAAVAPGSTVVISFGGDVASPYDGYWFYGIHSAELCVLLCGEDFTAVNSYLNGKTVVTVVSYPDRKCIISTNPENVDLHISVETNGTVLHRKLDMKYQSVGPAELIGMIESGELPHPLSGFEASVRLLSAITENLKKEQNV